MSSQVTRNNHYVPQWYQRGFLGAGQAKLYYLDGTPDQKLLENGRVITMNPIQHWGPASCFSELDLYSTHFGTQINDEIEKFLFGSIDARGAKAVRAFAGGDPAAMHESFQDFFEYLDAQKLRTPKGLDWIKARYSSLSQLDLMLEMQSLRFMHCTMWTEGVRELVSAEDSDVKFIVTDHPVTSYNPEFPPSSRICEYPDDPAIELTGTQTIFALDENTCLILTHLEYAKDPEAADLTAARTHARFRGSSLTRTDAFIRGRKLTRDEVVGLNHILKSRARRYIAAREREWLYPERTITRAWGDIASILLPKSDELWRFGGEIYVGYKDGSTHFQDEFGRTSRSHEYLRRKSTAANPKPNDACGCGSGRKYKRCCKKLPPADRPSWKVYGIRERNLMLCHAVEDILGLTAGKDWGDVQRELSDDHVKRIYQAFASLWPDDTDLTDLLPRPAEDTFRAVFLGVSDPRTIEATVLGWIAYFDEIVLAHPFINPRRIRPEFSPTESPSQHKAQTLKNVLLLLVLRPYIDAGYVHLIPDPGDFNPQFGETVHHMAQSRAKGWSPDRRSFGILTKLAEDDHRRTVLRLPEDSLRRMIGDSMPGSTEEELRAAISLLKSGLSDDPYALLQPMQAGEAGSQFLYYKGYGLESALYLAALSGSLVYTDTEAHWEQLHQHALQQPRYNAAWKPIDEALSRVVFPIGLDDRETLEQRESGRSGDIRTIMRQLFVASMPGSKIDLSQIAPRLQMALRRLEREWESASKGPRLAGTIRTSAPIGGFNRNEVQRLLLTFGRSKTVRPLPLAILIQLEGS